MIKKVKVIVLMQALVICALIGIIIITNMKDFIPLKGLVRDIEEISIVLEDQGIDYKVENGYLKIREDDYVEAVNKLITYFNNTQTEYTWTDVFADTNKPKSQEERKAEIISAKCQVLKEAILLIEAIDDVVIIYSVDDTGRSASLTAKLKMNREVEEMTINSLVDYIYKSFGNVKKDQIIIMDDEGHILSDNIND